MRNFKDLEIWESAHQLTLKIYAITKEFPKEEMYGLISQMRRSAQSIPTNIAEGCGRNSENELLRFCNIAMGSASELEYQLILSLDLDFLDQTEYQNLSEQLSSLKKRMNRFIQYLTSQKPNNPTSKS